MDAARKKVSLFVQSFLHLASQMAPQPYESHVYSLPSAFNSNTVPWNQGSISFDNLSESASGHSASSTQPDFRLGHGVLRQTFSPTRIQVVIGAWMGIYLV